MSKRLRGAIAQAAADLLYRREADGIVSAKRRAARDLGLRFQPRDLPSNRAVHSRYEALVRALASDAMLPTARAAALEALRWQRRWREWRPRVAQHAADPRKWELQLFAIDRDAPLAVARRERLDYRLDDAGEPWRVALGAPAGLALLHAAPLGPLTPGWLAEDQHAAALAAADPAGNLEDELLGLGGGPERFAALASALRALEDQEELAAGLAAFAQLRRTAPHDEELLTAALLHAFGPDEDGCEIAEALGELLTDRTRWLLAAAAAETLTARGCPTPADWDDAAALRHAAAATARGATLDEALTTLAALDGAAGASP